MITKVSVPQIPVAEIFSALKKTPAGQSLRTTPRFNLFKDSEPLSHWRSVLGPSAVTYSHMKFVHKITMRFLKDEVAADHEKFTINDRQTLLLAAACHDFGEAIIDDNGIGDIALIFKNKKHEEIERKVFIQVLDLMDLDKSLKRNLIDSYAKVVGGGKFFAL